MKVTRWSKGLGTLGLMAVLLGAGMMVYAHGDVTPQAVDTHELPKLGAEWLEANPYKGNPTAIRIGASAYNQNCARCHGLEAVSGGIAPDLRRLPTDEATDDYFQASVRRGKVRNGNVYMPPFEGIMSQEAVWALRSYIVSRHTED